MYRVLIADDERKARNVILKKGDWEKIGIDVAGEAKNGDQLIEMIDRLLPDIIISDMKMPGLSGAELIEYISEKHKEIKIIVISGFDDFTYTHQAIKSNVVDYLMKPIESKNLNDALIRAIKGLNEVRDSNEKLIGWEKDIKENFDTRKEILMKQLISGQEVSKEEAEIYIASSGIDIEQYYFSIAIIKIENYSEKLMQRFKSKTHEFLSSLKNIINKMFRESSITFQFKERNELVILFKCIDGKTDWIERSKEIMAILQKQYGIRLYIGLGREYNTYSQICTSYQEACFYMSRQLNILGSDRIGRYDDVSALNRTHVRFGLTDDEVFAEAVKSCNLSIIKTIVNKIYNSIEQREFLCIYELEKINSTVLNILEDLFESAKDKKGFIKDFNRLISMLEKDMNIPAVKKRFSVFLDSLSDMFPDHKNAKRKNIILDIRKYIENTHPSQLSLDVVSAKFYLSKQYISKKFKAEFGINLYSYIIKLRINKSKALLLQKDRKILEIVEEFNFTDESHYSHVFKKVVGLSPSEYRKMMLKD